MRPGFLKSIARVTGQVAVCAVLMANLMIADSWAAADEAESSLAEDVGGPKKEPSDPDEPVIPEPMIPACPSQPPLQAAAAEIVCPVQAGGVVCVANPSRTASASNLFHYWGNRDCGKHGCRNHRLVQNQFVNQLERGGRDQTNSCYICGCLRLSGCFAPGTTVRHADGTERLVDDLRVGDQLWNPVTAEPYTVRKVMEGAEAIPLIELVAGEFSVRVSQEHVVYTPDGFKRAKELAVGDSVMRPDGSSAPLDAVRQLPVSDGQYVINVELDGADAGAFGHLIESQGFVSGDLILQNNLEALLAEQAN